MTSFGSPYPVIVFTGGDPLMRGDLFELLSYARGSGVRVAVSPAVTALLTNQVVEKMTELGVSAVSISLDGASRETHDSIRRVEGTFDLTIERIRRAVESGLNVQVNTAVMRTNLRELPGIFHLVKSLGVRTWEVFFLVRVGRATMMKDLTPDECESVCNFLYDASMSGLTIRCVEAPFIRRVVSERKRGVSLQDETLFELRNDLVRIEGKPSTASTLQAKGTLDGDGVIFVGYDGSIFPGGLLPYKIGNIRHDNLARVYRENDLLRMIRDRRLNGHCGICEFKEVCGGSRARSFACSGDPLGSDPACLLTVKPVA